MMRLLTLATLLAVAASRVLAGTDAAVTSPGRLPQEHYDLGTDRQHLRTDSLSLLTDTDTVIDILQTIARRSNQDMRMFTSLLKQKQMDDERHLEEEVEKLQAEQAVLRRRWLRAKRGLKETKRKAVAASHASQQHAQALEKVILETLQEAEHLGGLKHKLDQQIQEAVSRRQASWWQGFAARWRARLAWLVRSINSLTWFPARQGGAKTHPDEGDACQEKPLRRWMEYSFAVLSYAFLAHRIYVHFRRRQDRRRLKFH